MVELTEGMRLEKRKNHTIEAIVDRIILKPGPDGRPDTRRLETSVLKALQMANGLVLIAIHGMDETLYSSSMACPDCGINVPRLEPRSFSFNSNYGACPNCHGLGSIYDFDPAKTITDWSKPLLDGAMGPGSGSAYLLRLIKLAAEKYKIDIKRPFDQLTSEQQHLFLYGPPRNEAGRTGFHGIFNYLRSNLEDTKSEGYREYMMQYMSASLCPVCKGRRLRPESLAVTIPIPGTNPRNGKNPGAPHLDSEMWDGAAKKSTGSHGFSIADFTALPFERALEAAKSMNFTGRDRIIADRLQREIIERLEFLNAVGLGYLALDRSAATLSGGEGQRIRLATQIGSRLRGVLYVLDEPSIGLHQRDNQRLINALENLRDLGNTVLVVEHDEDTIRKADYVLDLGPGAGKNGGHLIADGTPQQVMDNPASLTGQYLAGKIEILARQKPRELTGNWVTVEDAHSHNLQNVTAHFPLGVMTVITGVSGSGKSTLVNDILYRSLAKELYGSREEPGQHGRVIGIDQLDKVIQIDQSAIGRTPRSNPATYTGVFTAIRDLFAMLPESRERGYKPGRFSFNVQGGRCEACQGEGQRRIEMNFLPDVYVLCEVCNGRRYNQETLSVKFNGYSIADLLDLPIADAVPILKDIPTVNVKLQTLVDVGLGYIHLGQSATTLSGGEAQRMKLARELSKRQTGRTLYLLDEPTTGLHFDDVRKLLEVLHRLTDLGNTVVIIEHNLDIIRNADYVLDMGPEGGEGGGRIIAHGTPEQIATVRDSHTGSFLARYYTTHTQALTSRNGTSHAGPQSNDIVAKPDRKKDARSQIHPPREEDGPRKSGQRKARRKNQAKSEKEVHNRQDNKQIHLKESSAAVTSSTTKEHERPHPQLVPLRTPLHLRGARRHRACLPAVRQPRRPDHVLPERRRHATARSSFPHPSPWPRRSLPRHRWSLPPAHSAHLSRHHPSRRFSQTSSRLAQAPGRLRGHCLHRHPHPLVVHLSRPLEAFLRRRHPGQPRRRPTQRPPPYSNRPHLVLRRPGHLLPRDHAQEHPHGRLLPHLVRRLARHRLWHPARASL